MMRPPFSVLMAAYPRFVDRAPLFADIGWTDLVNDKAYWDTCAIRMSYALLHAGVALPGARMKANDGAIKGRYIEPGQARLSNILKKVWGQPEVYVDKASAQMGIGHRTGVVSFFHIEGGNGGHIDLIWKAPGRMFQDCARSCYFSAKTVWFWALV
jgi:hypothetical protein